MPGSFRKEDLRIIKTRKALNTALPALLCRKKFRDITVNDLCEEALVSRATFYMHFDDKYSLLHFWLEKIKEEILGLINESDRIETVINELIWKQAEMITNLLYDTDAEVLDEIHNLIASIIENSIETKGKGILSNNQSLLSAFCAGGIVNLLMMQIKHRFLPDTPPMNAYLVRMLEAIVAWDAKQDHP